MSCDSPLLLAHTLAHSTFTPHPLGDDTNASTINILSLLTFYLFPHRFDWKRFALCFGLWSLHPIVASKMWRQFCVPLNLFKLNRYHHFPLSLPLSLAHLILQLVACGLISKDKWIQLFVRIFSLELRKTCVETDATTTRVDRIVDSWTHSITCSTLHFN